MRSATVARSVDSWMPSTIPHANAPATARPTERVNARAGTVAATIGRESSTLVPNRSYPQPVTRAARASMTITAAYSTGTAAGVSRWRVTRWKEMTPNVAKPAIVRPVKAAYAQNTPGSFATSSDASRRLRLTFGGPCS
jgi:hypothetical protein